MLRFSATIFLILICTAGSQKTSGADPQPEGTVTLMGMLNEWIYPESKFHGAESSDAAVSEISSIKSKAALSTPDSLEKVLDFYCRKLKVDREGNNLGEAAGTRITSDRSVLIQDLSQGRSCQLYLVAINRGKSSTTLVISRCKDEETTQIAWSNFRQLAP